MTLRIDNIGFGDLKLIQDDQVFCYGVDAVLLADFAHKRVPDFCNAVDLGTGNGIIPLILHDKNPNGFIQGIDIMESNIDLAYKSLELNGITENIEFMQMDVTDIELYLNKGNSQIVTCNPPYFPKGGGIVNNNNAKFVARQETSATVNDFISAASYLLQNRGHFFMINRPSRLVDIFEACRKYSLEPKEMQMIAPREGKIPNLVLIHAIKDAGRELKILETLNIHEKGNSYTSNILEIYGKSK